MSPDAELPARPTPTGRGVLVAVIDSGIHASHPHVGGVSGGVAISANGTCHDDFVDRLGHGTAVAAAIREKAPDVQLLAVKVFDRQLSATIEALVAAIDWAVARGARIVNLSLGTTIPEHEALLRASVDRAVRNRALIVAAFTHDGARWLPGSLPDVIAVRMDRQIPRDRFRVSQEQDGRLVVEASGYPREIPGVPPDKNLKGISFAVANVSGFLARAVEGRQSATAAEAAALLASAQR